MTRRERITELLERWDDLQALVSAAGGRGGETRVPLAAHDKGCAVFSSLRCTCWLRSLAELEAQLRRLRAEDPRAYAHLNARYRHAERVRRQWLRYRGGCWQGVAGNEAVLIPAFVPGQQGKSEGLYEHALVVRWPAWVELRTVERALDWLEQHYQGEPQMPKEAIAA